MCSLNLPPCNSVYYVSVFLHCFAAMIEIAKEFQVGSKSMQFKDKHIPIFNKFARLGLGTFIKGNQDISSTDNNG